MAAHARGHCPDGLPIKGQQLPAQRGRQCHSVPSGVDSLVISGWHHSHTARALVSEESARSKASPSLDQLDPDMTSAANSLRDSITLSCASPGSMVIKEISVMPASSAMTKVSRRRAGVPMNERRS